MKHILLLTALFFCKSLTAKDWKPLQLDLNLIGIGVQTTYDIHPRWSAYAGVGFGWTVMSDIYTQQYAEHNQHGTIASSDVFLIGEHALAFYTQAGIKYYLTKPLKKDIQFYLRYQFKAQFGTIAFPSDEENFREHYRNALLVGMQQPMDTKRNWYIHLEAGAAVVSNYDWCVNRFAPQLNLKITYAIIGR